MRYYPKETSQIQRCTLEGSAVQLQVLAKRRFSDGDGPRDSLCAIFSEVYGSSSSRTVLLLRHSRRELFTLFFSESDIVANRTQFSCKRAVKQL